MADAHSSESPLDAVADTVGERTTEAFETLGNDTRLAILLALWDAQDPGPPPDEPSDPAVSFSDLRERVGMRDSGQFNYHLNKLDGPFVEQTEEGYTLTTAAEQILQAVFAGTLADPATLEGEPIDADCYRCGEATVIDYSDSVLTWRCTSCDGAFLDSDVPSGRLASVYRPPTGLRNRTPQEFHRHGNTWDRHRLAAMMEGVCLACSGAVTGTLHRCDDHDTHGETVCQHCGMLWELQAMFVCEICKNSWRTPGWAPIFTDVAVLAFYHEHGLDFFALYDEGALGVLHDPLEMTVRAADPLEVAVTAALDGDRLEVTLDDEARVIDVTKQSQESD